EPWEYRPEPIDSARRWYRRAMADIDPRQPTLARFRTAPDQGEANQDPSPALPESALQLVIAALAARSQACTSRVAARLGQPVSPRVRTNGHLGGRFHASPPNTSIGRQTPWRSSKPARTPPAGYAPG